MTYHRQKGRGYGYVIVLKKICRYAAGAADLSATSELLVNFGAPMISLKCLKLES